MVQQTFSPPWPNVLVVTKTYLDQLNRATPSMGGYVIDQKKHSDKIQVSPDKNSSGLDLEAKLVQDQDSLPNTSLT